MVNPQPRKTSVPIQFNFAHSKHKSTPSSKETACVLPRIQRYKKRPASIVVPQDTPVHRALPIAVQPVWTRVEITGLSPQLRRADLLELLRNYSISPEFRFPATPQFTRPFRTTILAAGVEEAGRMVKELSGKSVAGRKISVTMSIKSEGEDQKSSETGVHDVAEEWRNNIINTARIYFPNLAGAILEIREVAKDGSHFVFLQKRAPVTVYSHPATHAMGRQNKGEWEFVAGAAADLASEGRPGTPRLDALKSLQENLERQGVMGKIWGQWGGSQLLGAVAL